MAYLKIIRPVNLLLIIMVQLVIKYGLLLPLGVQVALTDFQFGLLIFGTVCIAAAGNVVNDIFDVAIDRINKPNQLLVGIKIREKAAYDYYIILNIIGVGTGFYISNLLGKPALTGIFIVISALLYSYASHIKAMFLIGNILVSILVAMSLIVVIIFDIFPALNTDRMDMQVSVSGLILIFAGFAFYINLIREIVKDIQDINGDINGGRKTLPIVLGRTRTVKVVFVMGVIGLLGVLYYTFIALYKYQYLAFYFIFLIAAPLLFFCIKAWDANKQADFKLLSNLLKIIMFTGIFALVLFPITLS